MALAEAAVVVRELAEVAAAECHGHLAGFQEVVRLVLPGDCPVDRGHLSAVHPHSIVPAAELRARPALPRDPVWAPEAEPDLRFSQEPGLALVPDRD